MRDRWLAMIVGGGAALFIGGLMIGAGATGVGLIAAMGGALVSGVALVYADA